MKSNKIVIVAGILLCKITPYENWSPYLKWAGDIFLRGLRMIVIPLVFTSIALGVAGMGNSAALGRIAGKTLLYYIGTTLIAAVIGLALVNLVRPGVGASLNLTESVANVGTQNVSFIDQIVNIVPANIFEAMAKGDLLPIIFFAVIFGLFNSIFVGGFFKTAYKFARPFVTFIIVCFLVIFIAEALHHVPGLDKLNAFGTDDLAMQLILLAAGIFIFLLLTVLSCRRACEQFERIDL